MLLYHGLRRQVVKPRGFSSRYSKLSKFLAGERY